MEGKMKRQISITLMILFIIVGLYSTAYSQNAGTVSLVGATEPNFLYLLTWNSGEVTEWTYIGGGITGADVQGGAATAGWKIDDSNLPKQVRFHDPDTSLTSGFVGGFVISGPNRGEGAWICHDNDGPVDGPLSVDLSGFTAYYDAPKFQVTLKWRTESEINNLGFDVYRSESLDGTFAKVNQTRIKGAGTTGTPHSYRFIDESVKVGETYYYYLKDISYSGVEKSSHIIRVIVDPTGKLKVVGLVPSKFALLQNYPNPFNPETWIPFQLARDASVKVRIYNLKGQPIRTLELGQKEAGTYLTKDKAVYWDGRDNVGEKVASGIYFYMLKAGEFTSTRRMVILE
jgi:hypothetical protein